MACAIIVRGKEVLIAQRPSNVHLGGFWEFPGGKLRDGESGKQALRREVAEELGIAIEVGPLIHRKKFRYPDRTVFLDFYRCVPGADARPRALEVQQWVWAPIESLGNYNFPPANEEILEILASEFGR